MTISFRLRRRSLLNLPVTNHRSNHEPRKRVLLCCFSCIPDETMENQLGWHRSIQAAARYDTVVIGCDVPSQAEQARRLSSVPEHQRPKIHRVALPNWQERLSRFPGLFFIIYRLWHLRAYRLAKKMHQQQPFDLVHQVNICSYREPGHLWKLETPFVWGPWGGTQNFPNRFLSCLDFRGACLEVIRNGLNWFQFRWGKIRSAMKEGRVLVVHQEAQDSMKAIHSIHTERQSEFGTMVVRPCNPKLPLKNRPIRILWSGRLESWKALPLLLHALKNLPDDISFELRVLGFGRLKSRWQALSRRLGLSEKIEWIDWPPLDIRMQQFEWADVFAFTSLRDTSGSGLFESLATSTPIIGLDHQGAHDIMDDQCALKVGVRTPKQVIRDFTSSIQKLARNPELHQRLSQGARRHANRFLWSTMAEKMARIYEEEMHQPTVSTSPITPPNETPINTGQRLTSIS